jgi:hypothetical protein
MEATQYELVTIKDIFDKVPADRIELCMKEIAAGMAQAKGVFEVLSSLAKDMGAEEAGTELKWPEKVTWIDDDKGEITMNCVVNDEPVLTVKTTPAAA